LGIATVWWLFLSAHNGDKNMELTKKLGDSGGSTIVVIPAIMCKYLNITQGDEIVIKDDKGKHGPFLSMWKKEGDTNE